MTSVIGIIGGSGFYTMGGATNPEVTAVDTPFSDEPVLLYPSRYGDKSITFLPRHGSEHGTPPHRINYRANLWALKSRGVQAILAVNVVGGIQDGLEPGALVVPDQVIDYTWGREHTFHDTMASAGDHIDFTWPYDDTLRQALLAAAVELGVSCADGGVYGCTQGPRLETAAEIRKLQADGCAIVGMTSMPEAALARELAIPYACIALVVNRAPGLTMAPISFADIAATLDDGIDTVRQVLQAAINRLH